jgi:hypothetical protein
MISKLKAFEFASGRLPASQAEAVSQGKHFPVPRG